MRRTLSTGALTGALLTAPLIAVSYLGWKTLDLPFAPFDLFDWMTRALPGAVATFGVDSMVRLTGALGVNTATTAKVAEQSMAIAFVLAAGAISGAVLFRVLSVSDEPASLVGAILGALLGGIVLLIEQNLNRLTSPGAFVSGTWVFATFLAWGVTFGRMYDRMRADRTSGARSSNRSTSQVDRRRFLHRLSGAAAAVTLVGTAWGAFFGRRSGDAGGARWSASHQLPNASTAVAAAPGTRPEITPVERHYRIDTDTRPPAISGQRWRLKIGGLVEQPLQLTLADLHGYEPLHQFVTLSCISNPIGGDLVGTTRWTGVSLQRLLPRLRPGPSATHMKLKAADGFAEVVALATIAADDRVMLAYAWDGVPLPIEHGFPLRLYVPDLYGMKQPKWIEVIEVLDHWEPGYWVERGWDRDGRMKSTSVVDAVAVGAKVAGADGRALTPTGGIALAGARGISKVEVQVDDGEWQAATLGDPLSDTTWVIWRADLPLEAGDRTITVRCYERDGTLQTSARHSKRIRI